MQTTIKTLRILIREILLSEQGSVIGKKNKDVELSSSEDLAKKIEPDLIDLVQKSYAAVGGNPKIKKPGDLSSEYSDWIVADVDDDPEVDAVVAGKPKAGKNKLALMASDGGSAAKTHVKDLMGQLLKNGWWAEVSDAPFKIAMKQGLSPVADEEKVRKMLGKEIEWHGKHPDGKTPGDGWYTRSIGGEDHVKTVVGDI